MDSPKKWSAGTYGPKKWSAGTYGPKKWSAGQPEYGYPSLLVTALEERSVGFLDWLRSMCRLPGLAEIDV